MTARKNRGISNRFARKIFSGWAAIVTAVTMVIGAAVPAHADNITDGFNPGNIISDAIFYNGNGYNAEEIQNFLNKRVSQCTLGQPGRPAGGHTSRGTLLAKVCLKDFRADTRSRPGDAYCRAYAGARGESAAEIIAKIGRACDINPKVLLVMLEKEQSLVTDSWPSQRMFDVAMGYACPDSGPGGSAECDREFYGFFNQMYYGARQLQRYRAHPGRWNYQAGRVNTVQYHPNRDCGTSDFYIENAATAGLYIYTPYRPNPAALAAGWGTGDACSTYGNRNFYNFFKSWFGSTQLDYAIDSRLLNYWAANSGWLGEPRTKVRSTRKGVYQEFKGGVIFAAHDGSRVLGMRSDGAELQGLYRTGFVEGAWGFPLSEPIYADVTRFTEGLTAVYEGRAYLVPNKLVDKWLEYGGLRGVLGAPKQNAVCNHGTGACTQQFVGGVIRYTADKRFEVSVPTAQELPAAGADSLFSVIKAIPSKHVHLIDIEGNQFSDKIQWIADRGITTGWSAESPPAAESLPTEEPAVSDGREFRPLAAIERQAMAAFMYRAAGSPRVNTDSCEPFNDVPKDHQFFTEICWMRKQGITTGYREDNTFRPSAPVTREAMAAFIYRLVNSPSYTVTGSEFIDLNAAGEFQREVAWLAGSGISTGWDTPAGKEYRPKELVARDAMAAFMHRMIESF